MLCVLWSRLRRQNQWITIPAMLLFCDTTTITSVLDRTIGSKWLIVVLRSIHTFEHCAAPLITVNHNSFHTDSKPATANVVKKVLNYEMSAPIDSHWPCTVRTRTSLPMAMNMLFHTPPMSLDFIQKENIYLKLDTNIAFNSFIELSRNYSFICYLYTFIICSVIRSHTHTHKNNHFKFIHIILKSHA